MFTDMGEGFIVEIGTNKGIRLLEEHAKPRPATRDDARERVRIRSRISHICQKRGFAFPKERYPNF